MNKLLGAVIISVISGILIYYIVEVVMPSLRGTDEGNGSGSSGSGAGSGVSGSPVADSVND